MTQATPETVVVMVRNDAIIRVFRTWKQARDYMADIYPNYIMTKSKSTGALLYATNNIEPYPVRLIEMTVTNWDR